MSKYSPQTGRKRQSLVLEGFIVVEYFMVYETSFEPQFRVCFSVSIWKRKQASSKLNVVRYNCKTFTIDTLDTRSWNQVKTDNKVWNLSQSTSNKIQLLLKYFNTKLSFESYNMPVGWNSKSPALNSFE